MATDLQAEEPCTVCGHAQGYHKQDDRCRFEECDCRGYDGATPLSRSDPFAMLSRTSDERATHARDTSTSRCGNWPASIGEMGKHTGELEQ